MVLFLCVWGEAANLRHAPECLAFLFHKCLAFLFHKLAKSAADGTAQAPPSWAEEEDEAEAQHAGAAKGLAEGAVEGPGEGEGEGQTGSGAGEGGGERKDVGGEGASIKQPASGDEAALGRTRFLRHVVRPLYEVAAVLFKEEARADAFLERGTK
ncbi:hypothetical protein T492DRAFT_885978, partial [Pavlovales sp. CCMP2436]